MGNKKIKYGIMALLAISIAGFYFVGKSTHQIKSNTQTENTQGETGQSKEENIIYDNNVIEMINSQMSGIELDKVRSKKNLIMEKSIEDIQKSIAKGELTYTDLTAFYLDRIKTYDKSKNGINAVMEVNPNAISDAKRLDREYLEAKKKGEKSISDMNRMFGIPVLLKDNINTKDMYTSGGTIAFKDFKPSDNAPIVNTLIKNKAIILGKSNLAELANYFDTNMPNGYSSKLGQTHNPFAPLMMSPQGSSSGSGAAVASNMSSVAIGTETTGSIIAPSYIQSLVGFKPTKGVISTEGVIPLSSTMDTIGPMAKSVKDAVDLFNASVSDPSKKIAINSNSSSLKNVRIGVFKDKGSKKIIESLKKLGMTPVEIDLGNKQFENEYIMKTDFAHDFAEYAKKYDAPIKSIKELVKFNEKDKNRRAKYGQGLLEELLTDKTANNPDKKKVDKIVKDTQVFFDKIMKKNNISTIAFKDSDYVDGVCVAGYPMVTVPFGESEFNEPTGLTFFGLKNEDSKLMNLAYSFEQATNKRIIPKKYLEQTK